MAAEWAGFQTVGQCEWADYPTKVLEKHWPDVLRKKDIRDVTGHELAEKSNEKITCISGGFPCQPHSLAGKRLASADERDLWDEFARIIRSIKPRWVVAENVLGLLSSEDGRFFGRILRDLAGMGYDARWGSISAFSAGAPHERKRVFIVANSNGFGRDGMEVHKQQRCGEKRIQDYEQIKPDEIHSLYASTQRILTNPRSGVYRNDDGLSEAMAAMKAYGNSVDPYQFYPIFQAIADIERSCQ